MKALPGLLLNSQDELSVVRLRARQQTRAAVQSTIRVTLNELPQEPYPGELAGLLLKIYAHTASTLATLDHSTTLKEGLQACEWTAMSWLLLVTDADDAEIPAVCSPHYDRKKNSVFRIAEATCH